MSRMEQMDKQVHDSAKAMFEQLMFIMIDHIKIGKTAEAAKCRKTLIECYNNSSDSCVRMLAKIRELEAGK